MKNSPHTWHNTYPKLYKYHRRVAMVPPSKPIGAGVSKCSCADTKNVFGEHTAETNTDKVEMKTRIYSMLTAIELSPERVTGKRAALCSPGLLMKKSLTATSTQRFMP